MNARKKALYLPPRLTAVSVKAERGYTFSADEPLVNQLNLWICEDATIAIDRQKHVEIYQSANDWNEDNGNFWY